MEAFRATVDIVVLTNDCHLRMVRIGWGVCQASCMDSSNCHGEVWICNDDRR